MKNTPLLAAVLILAPCAAYADPVYLDCTITSGEKGDAVWNVTLDEATSTASYRIPVLNVVQQLTAVLTANKVPFGSVEISRVDLSMVRAVSLLGTTKVDRGQCKLAAVPARKF